MLEIYKSRSSTMYTKVVIKHVQQQVNLISYVYIQKFTYVTKVVIPYKPSSSANLLIYMKQKVSCS